MEDRAVLTGYRLRGLREQKNSTQGEIEKRTGLLRTYVSHVENGYTLPALGTMEKFAHALEVPLYQLFYEGEEQPKQPKLLRCKATADKHRGSGGKDPRMIAPSCELFSRMKEEHRRYPFHLAKKMVGRNLHKVSSSRGEQKNFA